MRLRVLPIIALLLGALFVSGCAADASTPSGPSAATALDFSGTTVDGASFDGSSLAGKPTVLWFWAPWCPTCRRQGPVVAALSQKYAGAVNVVGVGSLDKAPAIEAFAQAVPADFPELSDPDGAIWKHFAITAQSTFVVLDADHQIVSSGYLKDDELAATVAGLVG